MSRGHRSSRSSMRLYESTMRTVSRQTDRRSSKDMESRSISTYRAPSEAFGSCFFSPNATLICFALFFCVSPFNTYASEVCTVAPAGRLCADNNFFRDDRGRVVILRGLNISGTSKVPPFLPLPRPGDSQVADTEYEPIALTYEFEKHTDLSTLDRLPGMGVNLIRLLFIWEAYEPKEGKFNEHYIEMLRSIISRAANDGIYVVIDFHQDVFSRYLAGGCGDGFPKWILTIPGSLQDTPRNDEACENWMLMGSFDWRVHKAFHDFYNGSGGAQQKYIEMQLAAIDALEKPPNTEGIQGGIIGYDLINEPFSDVSEKELVSLYQSAAERIWRANPAEVLFLEPNLLSDTGKPTAMVEPPVRSKKNIVYAPHYYDGQTLVPPYRYVAPFQTEAAFLNMAITSKHWRCPLLVGEFGASARTSNLVEYFDIIHAELNQHMASGAQWNYTPGWTPRELDGWNKEDFSIWADHELRPNLFQIRPYPQRISGTPNVINAETYSGGSCLRMRWNNDASLSGESILFFPKPSNPITPLSIRIFNVPKISVGCIASQGAMNDRGIHVLCTSTYKGDIDLAVGYGSLAEHCAVVKTTATGAYGN